MLQDYELKKLGEALKALYPEEISRLRDADRNAFAKYRKDPAGYIKNVLRAELTPKQIEVCNALMTYPYRVILVSAHSQGKSWLAGALVNWFYDCYDPGVTITTAPSDRDVKDVLWKEVRTQRKTRHDFPGPTTPELKDKADHYAKGYTGTNAEAFHGRHDKHMFFLVDEATGVGEHVFRGIKSMFKPTGDHFWMMMLNPIDTTSAVYAECHADEGKNYHVIRMNALDHPNMRAGLLGQPLPFPAAADLFQLNQWFIDWFEEVSPDDYQPGDVVWPPDWSLPHGLVNMGWEKQKVLRPGIEGQSRVLGLWPQQSEGAVWNDFAWAAACRELPDQVPLVIPWDRYPEIGCDVAREGGDKTEVVVQCSGVALEHVVGSGWTVPRTTGRLMELAQKYAHEYNENRSAVLPLIIPEQIPIRVDDDGVGGGVADLLRANGYRGISVGAGSLSARQDRYVLMRDQLWFDVAERAKRGDIDLTRLSKKSIASMRVQAMAVRWTPDARGRRRIVPKKETKKIIGRSPDSMDALNLAFLLDKDSSGVPFTFDQT